MSRDRLNQYHRIAADVLVGKRPRHVISALLQASEEGDLEQVKSLLEQHQGIVDLKCDITGDTPLIAAARAGDSEVVRLLLSYEADCTLQNDAGETALEVCSAEMRKLILSFITHEGTAAANPQILLHSAWLGDAVSIKKSMSGTGLDVNCKNSDGLTPVLLVTRDVGVFEKMQHAMKNEYNPLALLEELIKNDADVNARDTHGCTALHMMATNSGVHAKKMASLLLQAGANVGAQNDDQYTPLHLASEAGHTAIIVALVEEGHADVNLKGGKKGDTPLMLTAEHGHKEATRYLLEKGADVTAMDNLGNSALSVAKTPSLVSILQDAWTEQMREKERDNQIPISEVPFTPVERAEDEKELDLREEGMETLVDTSTPEHHSFFVTNRQMSAPCLEVDYADSPVDDGPTPIPVNGQTPDPILPVSEPEADDELESEGITLRIKPATRRNQIRQTLEDTVHKRSNFARERVNRRLDPSLEGLDSLKTLPSLERRRNSLTADNYSSTDEDDMRTRHSEQSLQRDKLSSASHDRIFKDHHQQGRRTVLQHSLSCLSLESLNRASPIQESLPSNMANSRHKKGMSLPSVRKVINSIGDRNLSFSVSQLMTKSGSTDPPPPDRLPALLPDLKPVALLTVDGENERMQVHKYDQHVQEQKREPPRSPGRVLTAKQKSSGAKPASSDARQRHTERLRLESSRSQVKTPSPRLTQRRSSFIPHKPPAGSSDDRPHQSGTAHKVSFLPSVVDVSLSTGLTNVSPRKQTSPPSAVHRRPPTQGRTSRLGQTSSQSRRLPQPPSSLNLVVSPQLAAVSEGSESSSSDKTITPSSLFGRELAAAKSPVSPTSKSQDEDKAETPLASNNMFSTGSFQPDSLETSINRAQNAAQPAAQCSNLVVNRALKDKSRSLSPIWNQMQLIRSESESTSGSYGDYIASYIGKMTPFPHNLLAQDPSNSGAKKVSGRDSGQYGESDEEAGHHSSSSDNEEMPFTSELKWRKGNLLGKGAFGKVWEGLMDSAKLIAVKEVELDVSSQERAQSQFKKIQMEVDILRSLRHRNIVQYYGASMDNATIYIFMEYVSGGSLQSILKRFGALEERAIAHYTRQIARGLDYLHYNGIIHRDIKGANIMLTSKGVIKLIDFGCAKRYCQAVSIAFHSVRGTPYWMAPEVICGHGYGRKSDIWSLGCTVHEMALVKPPWGDLPPEAAMFQIGIGYTTPRLPETFSDELTSMFNRCLQRDPSMRPTARELLEDPFLLLPTQNKAAGQKSK